MKQDEKQFDGIFFFDPADKIYADHFPGNPVVPGSLIVSAFIEAARTNGLAAGGYTIENFRFREFISPGEYPFRVRTTTDQLHCELYNKSKAVVTGIVKL